MQHAIEGAASQGADVQIRHLADLAVPPSDGHWNRTDPDPADDVAGLQSDIEQCSALIVGAPVYFLDVNGLTKDFMDQMRPTEALNGKRALGITIAGGSGKGLILALKTIYHFFFCLHMRGLTPTPVSRFSFDAGMRMAHRNGAALVKPPIEAIPFHNLTERISWINQLPFMNADIIDENFYLAKAVVDSCRKTERNAQLLTEARSELVRAAQLVEHGQKQDALEHIMKAYESGTEAWTIGRES